MCQIWDFWVQTFNPQIVGSIPTGPTKLEFQLSCLPRCQLATAFIGQRLEGRSESEPTYKSGKLN
jgi:hypothetical protein